MSHTHVTCDRDAKLLKLRPKVGEYISRRKRAAKTKREEKRNITEEWN